MRLSRSYLFLFLLLATSPRSHAQYGYGGEIGLGMSSMRFAPEMIYSTASKKPVFSSRIGAIVDLPMNKTYYFQTGLYCSLKGQQRNFSFHRNDSFNASVSQSLHLYYVDVPLNICVKSAMQGKGRIIGGIGASLCYNFAGSGTFASKGALGGFAFDDNFKGSIAPNTHFKAFDLGLNLFAGYELPNGWFFKAYYSAGINDIGTSTEIDKNRMWGLGAGYLLGKGRNINKEKDELIER